MNRIFQPYEGKSIENARAQLKREASVLDLTMVHTKSLHGQLGTKDQRKMDEYLESIRALEQRVELSSQGTKPHSRTDEKKRWTATATWKHNDETQPFNHAGARLDVDNRFCPCR